MTPHLESAVEARLHQQVRKRLGGMTFKIAPTTAGIPDRLVMLPGMPGSLHLVELKAIGGRLRPIQLAWHHKAAAMGVHVSVVTGMDGVDAWVEDRLSEMREGRTVTSPGEHRHSWRSLAHAPLVDYCLVTGCEATRLRSGVLPRAGANA